MKEKTEWEVAKEIALVSEKTVWEAKEKADIKREKALDLIYKKTYYRNINTIRKNVQYFFWVSIIGIVSTIIFILLV